MVDGCLCESPPWHQMVFVMAALGLTDDDFSDLAHTTMSSR